MDNRTIDDLNIRCRIEVERAMNETLHIKPCEYTGRIYSSNPADNICICDWRTRLLYRLAGMLEAALRYGGLGWENGLQEVIKASMAIQHYEPDREHDAELRRTVLTKIQNIACGRIGGHIGENCGCFKKGMLDIPQDSVAKLNQIIEITDNELRKLY